MTIPEAAKALGVSTSAVWNALKRLQIPAVYESSPRPTGARVIRVLTERDVERLERAIYPPSPRRREGK